MEQIIEKVKCTGCAACMNICPQHAITMVVDENGFKNYQIDNELCVNCGLCQKVCPVLNNMKENKKNIDVYACFNKNEEERRNSSSGGVFILLAKEIIKRNGVVFGACFDNSFRVIHSYAETVEDVKKMMGSKYVQSDIGGSYKNVKDFLEAGKYVLFTGTPCQIEGLKSYLMKDYDRLYTQDIICHGVPSPKVWDKYLEYRKKQDNAVPKKINFRNKDNGWSNFNMKINYINEEYVKSHHNDYYFEAFLKNTCLRDSCYHCSFKKKYRESDITLADFWGIKNINETMFDDKGTSLVIANSKKGKELLESIKDNIIYKNADIDAACIYNTPLIESVIVDKNRKAFFKNLDKLSFDKLIKKYTYHLSFKEKVLLQTKKYLKRLLR